MQHFSPFQGLRTHRAETSCWCSWRWSWFETCSLLSHHLWGAVHGRLSAWSFSCLTGLTGYLRWLHHFFLGGSGKWSRLKPTPPFHHYLGEGPALCSTEAFQRWSRKTGGISVAYFVGYRPDSGHRNLWRRHFPGFCRRIVGGQQFIIRVTMRKIWKHRAIMRKLFDKTIGLFSYKRSTFYFEKNSLHKSKYVSTTTLLSTNLNPFWYIAVQHCSTYTPPFHI